MKPYCIADANHVVVGDQVIAVKPGKFKRIGKHSHFYFIGDGQLYKLQGKPITLVPVAGPDVKTFKVLDEDTAEDKDGEMRILVTLRPQQDQSQVRVLRGKEIKDEADRCLAIREKAEQEEKRKSPLLPGDFSGSLTENLVCLGQWLTEDFAARWAMQRTNLQLYRLVSVYLKWCTEAFQDDHQEAHLKKGLSLFQRFPLFSWLHPEMLYHAAQLYVQAGQPEQAIDCCKKAFHYRSAHIAEFLADESLRPLKLHPEFIQLQKEVKASEDDFEYVSLPLIEACEQAIESQEDDKAFTSWMRQQLLYKFRFYQQSELISRIAKSSEPEKLNWQRLAQKNQFYFEHYMLLEGPGEVISEEGKRQWNAFLLYHEYQQLQPLAYLRMADIFFREAHQWANWKCQHFEDTRQVLAPRIKEAGQLIAYFQELMTALDEDTKTLVQESAENYSLVQIMRASGKPLK
ncbi:hypothetical protein CWE09_03765 [Aliidiomarina minuta]|uniref:Uncharacterized protein n=1 Tax=Aliidiomarina minuta TaxID=880057 RepID=A0A432W712_9GAMM|nr:hypothetical protein [Aliidiomarina minuta]RUO25857.1 hypothetical protein CWE09_03765 [Aliidiomarina minuta]